MNLEHFGLLIRRKAGRPDYGSQQSAVGKFLKAEMTNHPITKTVSALITSDEWLPTINYRDVWVHRKPPIIEGMGINYERRNRLQVSDTSIGVSFGGGDPAQYTVDELIELIRLASIHFTGTVRMVVQYYSQMLRDTQGMMINS